MKLLFATTALMIGMLASGTALAQAPAGAPAGATGLCKDGSFTTNATKKGACNGHKGVKDWFSAAAPAPAASAMAPASNPAAKAKTAAAMPAAAGGGAGQVWVNADSKVYHCAGSRYYGKTKKGEYMTEAAAKAAGNHADHGKACGA